MPISLELSWLSASLVAKRQTSAAQQSLVNHHAAYWDLQAVLLNVPETTIDRSLRTDMWTVREILKHIFETEWSFTLVNDFTLQRAPGECSSL